MNMASKALREPLVQFLGLGILLFGTYSLIDGSPPAAETRVVEVGKGQLSQMFATFSRTWQRPPTEAEFEGLVDGYVKEEIFYREGLKMRLDENDSVFRRRMQQKMEFLLEPSAQELTPKPGELVAYFKAHADKYRLPAQVAFRQIFFNGDNDGTEAAARIALSALAASPAADASGTGDPTLLPARMELTEVNIIAGNFDEPFANQLVSAPTGRWSGPVRSQYGIHLVFVEQRTDARPPSFDDISASVLLDWESARRKEIADRRFSEMKAQYEVRILWPKDMASSPIEISGVQ
jgi:hypothetical protein